MEMPYSLSEVLTEHRGHGCQCCGLGLCPALAWIFRCRAPPDLTRVVRLWPWLAPSVPDLLRGSSFGPRRSDFCRLLPQPVVAVGLGSLWLEVRWCGSEVACCTPAACLLGDELGCLLDS
jgi:hypothetical protein